MSYKKFSDLPKSSEQKETYEENPNVLVIKTAEEKQHLIQRNKVCVVDIWASWCTPCKNSHGVYANLAQKYGKPTICAFLKEEISLGLSPSVKSVPTFHFYRDGKLVDEVIGADIPLIEKKVLELTTK